MKKLILVLMLSSLVISSFGQQLPVANEYLQQSKKQKKTGTILLVSGAVLTVAGSVMWLSQAENIFRNWEAYDDNKMNAGAAIAVTGGTMITISIPFFIAAGRNKRMAMSVGLKNEPVQQIQSSSLVLKNSPSLTLKFSL